MSATFQAPATYQVPMKQTFDVSGMTCAACKARVEKAAAGVEGVSEARVNLLKNSMEVECASVSPEEAGRIYAAVCAAVDKAGYAAVPRADSVMGAGASGTDRARRGGNSSLAGAPPQSSRGAASSTAATVERSMRVRLIVSVAFCIPLFYLAMGHMLGLPIPRFFQGDAGMLPFAFTQFLLLLPVVFVNFKYFSGGFKSLFHAAPNMDSLIALGATASTAYGIAMLYVMGAALGSGDVQTARDASMNLYFDSASMILTLITLGKYFEARAKGKTTGAIESLMNLAPKNATVLRDGVEAEIPADQVCVGDILVVRSGESIPVDGVVLEGSATVDESAITGESTPVEKAAGDSVTGATVSRSGWFKMEARRVGADTVLAGIIRLVDEATSTKAPIEKLADRISGVFVPAVMGIAIVVFAIWLLVGGSFQTALSHAITVLVISCPCALGLATPTAIMVGMGRGATHGLLIKSAEALEAACEAKTVVLDKTGTITSGIPDVVGMVCAPGRSESELLSVVRSMENLSEHPLAKAMVRYAEAHGAAIEETADFAQIAGGGVRATVSGKACIAGNARLMGDESVELGDLASDAERFADEGATPIFFACEGEALGMLAVADTVKPTSAQAIAELERMGVRTVMVTGDNERTARAVQKSCGVGDFIAGVLPQGKAREVERLAKSGRVVMVGDGVNDAVALVWADVGIAIGAGTDVAIESADVVLVRNDLLDAAGAIQLSRATMRVIKQNLFWALFYNAICIPIAAGALSWAGVNLSPMIAAAAMSLSSVCVVSNALRLRGWRPTFAGDVGGSEGAEDEGVNEGGDAGEGVDESGGESESDRKREDDNGRESGRDNGNEKDGNERKDGIMEKTLHVEGMMCQNCVKHVKKALEGVEGVTSASVDLEEKTATVELSAGVSDKDLIASVAEEGYKASMA